MCCGGFTNIHETQLTNYNYLWTQQHFIRKDLTTPSALGTGEKTAYPYKRSFHLRRSCSFSTIIFITYMLRGFYNNRMESLFTISLVLILFLLNLIYFK